MQKLVYGLLYQKYLQFFKQKHHPSTTNKKKSNQKPCYPAKGRKRRMGFNKKGKNSFTVHRSEEILPGEMRGALSRGSSASSDGEGSGGDGDRFERLSYTHTHINTK